MRLPVTHPPVPRPAGPVGLTRRLVAEAVGTGLLVAVVVGSGIAAQHLSPDQLGLQLLENSTATVFGLGVLIVLFGPVSGAHFNPLISAIDWVLAPGTGLVAAEVAAYATAQACGAVAGAVLANVMFDLPAAQLAGTDRLTSGHLVGEVVATAGLVAVVFALSRTARVSWSAPVVAAWIGTAYWFTSSTSFANPAVTLGRIFTDTFTGIAPTSAAAFIAAQTLGAGLGAGLVLVVYPDTARPAGDAFIAADPPRAVS